MENLERNKFYMEKGHPEKVVYIAKNGEPFRIGSDFEKEKDYVLIENPGQHIEDLVDLTIQCDDTAKLMQFKLEQLAQICTK